MTKELHDLLSKQHKFGAPNENLPRKLQGRISNVSEDLKEIEINVKSLLISLGHQCRVSELEEEYRKLFGKRLPFRNFGSSSSVELLKRIPEACEICDESSDPLVSVKSSQKSAHIITLVQKSKAKPKQPKRSVPQKDVFVPFTVQDEIRRILFRKGRIRKSDFIKLLEEKFDLNYFNLKVSVDVFIRNLPHIIISDGPFVKSAYKIKVDEIEIPEELVVKGAFIIPSFRLGHYESQVSKNISTLLSDKKQMYVIDIPRFYLKRFGKELKWYQFGFEELWRFLLLLPGEFTMFNTDSGYVVASSAVPGTVDIREFHEQDLCGEHVYEEILEKIRHLVLQMNKGLNSKHLMSAYETFNFEKLVLRTNFHQFLNELHGQLIFEMKEIGESCVLFPCDMYKILQLKEKKLKNVEQHQPLPMDVLMKPWESLRSLEFPNDINVNKQQFCAGFVSFVQNPNDFCIRIAGLGENHKMELEKEFRCMSEDMNQCYSRCSEEYDIPRNDLRVEMVCAACVKNNWHRVEILELLDGDKCSVKSVDYGSCHRVTLSSLKYLPRRFSEFPIFAYSAKLFNIKPVGREWEREAIFQFRTLTIENNMVPKPLSVLIVHRSKYGVMQVVLSDESWMNTASHIGDKLVDQGYALFKTEDQVIESMYSERFITK